jgi:UTP:GlnB (protein PII) uridylyltransferase
MMRRGDALLRIVEEARGEEQPVRRNRVSVEPNVSCRGATFNLSTAFEVRVAEPDGLKQLGVLREDHEALVQAWEFLLHIRNEMHFHAAKSVDLLDKAEQWRLAELLGYEAGPGQLPVERFMQAYFQLTSRVNSIAQRFAEEAKPRAVWSRLVGPLVSHRFDHDFSVGPAHIGMHARAFPKLQTDLAEVLGVRPGEPVRQAH